MTVWDNVAFGPRSAEGRQGRDRPGGSTSCSRSCGSTDFADRKPAQLSGGQQQRVALARALVNYPSALLLDEPLGALDLKLRQAMQLELKRIQREVGITFVYVTHDQEEALTMSDRIAVMNEGGSSRSARRRDLRRPATVFVAGFIGQANLWPCRVTGGGRGDARPSTPLGSTLRSALGSDAASRPAATPRSWSDPSGSASRRALSPPTGADVAVAATVTDLVFQGPVVRLALTHPTARRGRRPRRPRRASCRCCGRATACGRAGRRRVAGPARRRHPRHRASRMLDEG